MAKDIDTLLKKLIKEKFKGKNPKWRRSKLDESYVLRAEDKENWYYRHDNVHGNVIYYQSKNSDHTTRCYGCGSQVSAVPQPPEGFRRGEIRKKHIPYCLKCEIETAE